MIKPLVETYVASLPATHAGETWRDLGITPPTGVVEKTVEKGIAPKSQVAIVFSGPVRVRRRAPAGAADDDAGAAVAAVRHDPAGARRHLQHHRRAADARSSRGPNTACGSSGRATRRARRRSCSACSTRSRSSRTRPSRRSRWTRIRAALLRDFEQNSQDNGYLLNQIARRYADGDAGTSQRRSTCRPDCGADRRGDPAGGADLSRHRKLRESHADAGDEVGRRE